MAERSIKCCGNCAHFSDEDANGLGFCDVCKCLRTCGSRCKKYEKQGKSGAVKNIPGKIYLNLGFNPLWKNFADVDFNELAGVTWSKDKTSDGDIEYVLYKPFDKPVDWEARRFELVKESLKSILSNLECQITTDELANSCVSIADAIIAKMKGGEE